MLTQCMLFTGIDMKQYEEKLPGQKFPCTATSTPQTFPKA